MREIKFRAWNTYNKKMIRKVIQMRFTKNTGWNLSEWNEMNGEYRFGSVSNSILMQFTGLKDINNKEIYHRDIVKFKPCNDISLRKEFREQEIIAQIIWDNELAKFDVDWSGHAEYHSEFPHFKMEVIGNMFKNPELLK